MAEPHDSEIAEHVSRCTRCQAAAENLAGAEPLLARLRTAARETDAGSSVERIADICEQVAREAQRP